jgi:hypothetical protein
MLNEDKKTTRTREWAHSLVRVLLIVGDPCAALGRLFPCLFFALEALRQLGREERVGDVD